MFHLTPLEQIICPFKKIEVGLQTPPLPQIPYGKGQKCKIWIVVWGQNVFTVTWKVSVGSEDLPVSQKFRTHLKPHISKTKLHDGKFETYFERKKLWKLFWCQTLPYLRHICILIQAKRESICHRRWRTLPAEVTWIWTCLNDCNRVYAYYK